MKIYLDTKRVNGWNEIDAVELVGKDGSKQWAVNASASSTYASKTVKSQQSTPTPELTYESLPPSVVKTSPQAGDTAVDPALDEVRVTFSKDMLTERMWAFCQVSADTFPQHPEGKQVHYLADKRTCVLPVKLQPGKTYVIWINRGRFNSFRDTQNNPSVPYLLVFETNSE